MVRRLITILFLASSAFSFAQTLDECHTLAEANYPAIRQYKLLDMTTEYTLDNLKKGWLPQLSLSALDLQQRIWDRGATKAQKEVAKRQCEVSRSQTKAEIYAVRNRVDNLYFGILLLKEKARLNDAFVSLVSSNSNKIENLLNEGVATRNDLITIKAELLEAKQKRTELECSIVTMQKMLSLLCGKEITELSMPEYESAEGNFSARPEWQFFASKLSLIDALEKAVNTKVMPKISFFAQGFYGYPGLDMYEDMFSHKWSLNGILGIRMQWNISGFYTRGDERKLLGTQRSQVENAKDVFLFNSEIKKTNEQLFVERTKKLLAEDDELISLRKEIRETAEAKLEDGVIDISGLLQEMTREQQAQIRKIEHQIEMQQHLSELKYTVGYE